MKAGVELHSFANPTELGEAAANYWLTAIKRAKSPFHVALSGGRIATQFFGSLVDFSRSVAVSFQQVHFFWADERCVPPDDAESNFAMTNRTLFEPLGISPSQIHRIRGEDSPVEAVRMAELDLRRTIQSTTQGYPVLDLIFLGMGEDGHVASLFPQDIKSAEGIEIYRSVVSDSKPPPRRVTLTYEAIAAARDVTVLISGQAKAAVLQQSLREGAATPLGRVLGSRACTHIMNDFPVK